MENNCLSAGGLSKQDIYHHERSLGKTDLVARRQFNQLQRQRRLSAGAAGPLNPPRTLQLSQTDTYLLTNEMHHGAGGDGVYVAKMVGRTTYVIKRMPQVRELRGYFKNEIKVLRTLRHPRIVGLVGAYSLERYNFLVLQHAKKGDLLEVVYTKPKQFSITQRLKIVRQIIDGLDYAHKEGYAHRDLKPENVFLKENNDIVIGDWAFATNKEKSKEFLGSFQYISPQILAVGVQKMKENFGVNVKQWADTQPQEYACKPVDVWALGVMCCDMLFLIDYTIDYVFGSFTNSPYYFDRLKMVKDKRWGEFWKIVFPKEATFTDLDVVDQVFWKEMIESMLSFEAPTRVTMKKLFDEIHKTPQIVRQSM